MGADHQRLLDVGGLRRSRDEHREPAAGHLDPFVRFVQVVNQRAHYDGKMLGEEADGAVGAAVLGDPAGEMTLAKFAAMKLKSTVLIVPSKLKSP